MIAQASKNLLCCLKANIGWADFNFRLERRQYQPVGLGWSARYCIEIAARFHHNQPLCHLLFSTTLFPFLLY